MYPLAKFVAAPKVGARVLLDLNPGAVAGRPEVYLAEGWDLGVPSLDGPVDAAGRAWGSRQLRLPTVVDGTRAEGVRVVGEVSRILTRARTWLLWQLDATAAPVWFEVYATEPGDLDPDQVITDDPRRSSLWEIDLRLDAAPWAVGAEIELPGTYVTNDPFPTRGAPGGQVWLGDIKGDAATPLEVRCTPDGFWSQRRIVVASASFEPEAPPGVTAFAAADFIADVGVTLTSASGWAGGGYRQVTSGHDTMARRMRREVATGGARPGRYLVYALAGTTDATVVHDVQVAIRTGGTVRTLPAARFAAPQRSGLRSWVPCGEVELPIGVHARNLDTDSQLYAFTIEVATRRVSGTGTINLGGVQLVPVAGPGIAAAATLTMRLGEPAQWPMEVVVHGDEENVAGETGGAPIPFGPHELRGAFPVAVPGTTTVVRFIQQASGVTDGGTAAGSDDSTEGIEVTFRYRPRYLWMTGGVA